MHALKSVVQLCLARDGHLVMFVSRCFIRDGCSSVCVGMLVNMPLHGEWDQRMYMMNGSIYTVPVHSSHCSIIIYILVYIICRVATLNISRMT